MMLPVSRIIEAACLRLGLLVALACTTTACSAPYHSFYVGSIGGGLAKPISKNDDVAPTGRMSFGLFEVGDVKSGFRPGWSVTGYPAEVEWRGERSSQISVAAVGARFYLGSHLVNGRTPNYYMIRDIWGRYRAVFQKSVPTVYQVVALGVETKVAPLAFNGLFSGYNGFGEAALFATASIPHGYGWGLEFRAGTQYAVDTGGTLFARLEVTIVGARQRPIVEQFEKETWDSPGTSPNENDNEQK